MEIAGPTIFRGTFATEEAFAHAAHFAKELGHWAHQIHGLRLAEIATVAGGVLAAIETAVEGKQHTTAGKIADPVLTGATETFFGFFAAPVMAADAIAQLSLGVARKERTATRYSVAGHLTFPIHGLVAILENNEDYKRELLNNLLSGDGPILWSKLATFYDGLGRGGNTAVLGGAGAPSTTVLVETLHFEPEIIFRFDPVVIHRHDHHHSHHATHPQRQ